MEFRKSLNLDWGGKCISIFTIVRLNFSISLDQEYRQQIELLLDLLLMALIQNCMYYCVIT